MSDFDSQTDNINPDSIEVSGNEAALDLPVDRRLVDRLFRAGAIDDRGRQQALRFISGPVVWWPWIDRALLFLGLTLALVGVVCFFAWNWDDLPGFVKLGLVQLGIVVCCGVALWKGLETKIGKAAQIGASILVGVFLAVFDQVYQMGADEWLLFAGWAALILPWTALARFDALWILWLTIVNVALWLCWEQALSEDVNWEFLAITLGLLNGTALGLKEYGQQQGYQWLQMRWPRHLLVPATLGPLITPVLGMIVEVELTAAGSCLSAAVFAGVLGITHWFFRHKTPDLISLSCTATSVCVLVTFLAGKLLFEVVDDAPVLIMIGGVIIGVVTVAAKWLIHVAREFRETGHEEAVL